MSWTFLSSALSHAHASWQPVLERGLVAMHVANPGYFANLEQSSFLPSQHRLFAAFTKPLPEVRYVLIGEGPYPREQSATGYSFMDGAVEGIWADDTGGFSKPVNRATSLRNFLKMLLVTDGLLSPTETGIPALSRIRERVASGELRLIDTLSQLQQNLLSNGFLLLNASLVFRTSVAPQKDAQAWRPMLQAVLGELSTCNAEVQLLLWGKIAEQIRLLPEGCVMPAVESEHPYNLSFIGNTAMQNFFRPLRLLHRA